jgi:predicted peptidase
MAAVPALSQDAAWFASMPAPAPNTRTAQKFAGECGYWVWLPEGYPGNRDWPMLITVGGTGEIGDVRRLINPDLSFPIYFSEPQIRYSDNSAPRVEFVLDSFIIVAPAVENNGSVPEMVTMLDNLVNRFDVDVNHIYLAGACIGGAVVVNVAEQRPNLTAAVALFASPVYASRYQSGFPDMDLNGLCVITDRALHFMQCYDDYSVPFAEAGRMVVDRYLACGGTKIDTLFEGGNSHTVWGMGALTGGFADTNFYKWLLSNSASAAVVSARSPVRPRLVPSARAAAAEGAAFGLDGKMLKDAGAVPALGVYCAENGRRWLQALERGTGRRR